MAGLPPQEQEAEDHRAAEFGTVAPPRPLVGDLAEPQHEKGDGDDGEDRSGREAASPEFTARLNATFPRGSDANTVAAGLSTEGFRPIGPCRDNPRNERAGFEQRGGSIAGPYPVSALAA